MFRRRMMELTLLHVLGPPKSTNIIQLPTKEYEGVNVASTGGFILSMLLSLAVVRATMLLFWPTQKRNTHKSHAQS